MAIVFQRAVSAVGQSVTIDIGAAGNDRLLICQYGDESIGTDDAAMGGTPSVDGKNFTLRIAKTNPDGIGNQQEFWVHDEGSLGSSNGSLSVSGGGVDASSGIRVALWYGVDDGVPTDTAFDDTTVGDSPSANIDVPAAGLIVAGAGNGSTGGTASWTSPLTERIDGATNPPASAILGLAEGIESSAQTNKAYTVVIGDGTLRSTLLLMAFAEAVPPPSAIDASPSLAISAAADLNSRGLIAATPDLAFSAAAALSAIGVLEVGLVVGSDTVIATDAMSGTNDPLSNNGSWSLTGATDGAPAADGIKEGSGRIEPNAAGSEDDGYFWDADAFADNQYGQITMTLDVDSANHRIGIMLRAGSGTAGFMVRYRTGTADSDFEAWYFTGVKARTQLTSPTADQGSVDGNNLDPSEDFLAGDIMRVEVAGKTITLKIDFGSGFVTQGSWDATGVGPASGSAGLYMAGGEGPSSIRGDDWEGGNLGSASPPTMVFSVGANLVDATPPAGFPYHVFKQNRRDMRAILTL